MAKKKAAQTETEKVQLLPVDIRRFEVQIRGLTAMIQNRMHNFEPIRKKQAGEAQEKRKPRNPEQEFRDACLVMPGHTVLTKGCVYAVKATWFKCGAVRCLPILGLPMKQYKGTFSFQDVAQGYIPMEFKGHPEMREDWITLPNGNGDLRYRPEFRNWGCRFTVIYNASRITAEQIINALQLAGVEQGAGELRPSQGDGGGQNGQYEVLTRPSRKPAARKARASAAKPTRKKKAKQRVRAK